MLTCPACGRDNPDGSSFCNACGADLAEPAAAEREYRKVVTLLFCDVVGSTALGESTDPEALRALLGRYFDEMKAIVERHGGTVEKFIGDAVMAVFGVPQLHEDDALRAVRAAVEMRDALPVLGVEARIGVNTGEVVVGTAERLATGDAVNVAARLEQAAGAGEVLLGAETAALVRDAVETEELELELKGKSEPLVAHRLVSLQAQAPAFARRFDAQLVGRERELRRLQEAFGQAGEDRSCQLFTLLGTAGVGKSRLTAEFIGSLDGARVVRGRCLPYGEGITYWPVIEVLKQLPPARELDLDPAAVAAIEGLLGDEPAVSSTEEIPWALRTLLESAAASAPVVVVFDDIHWAEPAFLDLIEHVADLSRAAPILLLCLARPELLERRPGWGGGKLNATTVLLEPLSATQTDELLERLLGEATLDEELRERIRDAAEGNPLFVEEMVAFVEASGDSEVTVPGTIQALLAARLDQLEPGERGVLERGSVEGRVFHRGAVQALAPEETQVESRLTGLVRKELVRPDKAQLTGEDAYRFRHLLIRDAAYEALPKATRAELHELFADWLAEHGLELVELDEILGYHLEQAHRYRTELGEENGGLGVRAAERLTSAGRRSLMMGDGARRCQPARSCSCARGAPGQRRRRAPPRAGPGAGRFGQSPRGPAPPRGSVGACALAGRSRPRAPRQLRARRPADHLRPLVHRRAGDRTGPGGRSRAGAERRSPGAGGGLESRRVRREPSRHLDRHGPGPRARGRARTSGRQPQAGKRGAVLPRPGHLLGPHAGLGRATARRRDRRERRNRQVGQGVGVAGSRRVLRDGGTLRGGARAGRTRQLDPGGAWPPDRAVHDGLLERTARAAGRRPGRGRARGG